MSAVLANGLATFTMHDPKLSASVAQQQLMMSEALLDNVSGQGLIRPHYHLTNEHYEPSGMHGKMPSLSRAVDDVAEMTSHLSFLQRMKELGVGVDVTRGSILSDLPSQYSYTDLLYARYAALHSDAGFLSSYTDRLLGAPLYPGRHCVAAPGVAIKDYSPLAPPSRTLPTSSSRAPDTLSLSPLHISTTLASSSPPSSLSTPSPHRQSSVSPDSCTDFYSHRRHNLSSSLTRPSGPLTLYEERIIPTVERALGPCLPNPHHPWQTPTSSLVLRPPLLSLYEPLVTSMDTRSTVGHFLDYYLTSSSLLAQNFHRHHPIKESSFNGVHSSLSDTRSSPGKELTTKTWKQDRARERQDVSSILEADKEHTERLSNVKKSASTQTQCSSFSFENQLAPIYYSHDTITHDKLRAGAALPPSYPHPPPPLIQYTAQFPPPPPRAPSLHPPMSCSSLITHPSRHLPLHPDSSAPSVAASQALMQMRSSPPMLSLPPYHSTTPPPPPKYGEHTGSRVDVQHAPLNLSLSSVSLGNTVSKCSANSLPMGSSERDQQEANQRAHNKNGSSHETGTQDEAIEEHFRRSLGKCYNEPSPPKKVTLHVSDKICSVDDHFARALGDQMWTEIKARSEPNIDPSTVDAHFAKALGANMWKKLKAENKLVDELSSSSPSQQHPSCSTSSLQTSLAT